MGIQLQDQRKSSIFSFLFIMELESKLRGLVGILLLITTVLLVKWNTVRKENISLRTDSESLTSDKTIAEQKFGECEKAKADLSNTVNTCTQEKDGLKAAIEEANVAKQAAEEALAAQQKAADDAAAAVAQAAEKKAKEEADAAAKAAADAKAVEDTKAAADTKAVADAADAPK